MKEWIGVRMNKNKLLDKRNHAANMMNKKQQQNIFAIFDIFATKFRLCLRCNWTYFYLDSMPGDLLKNCDSIENVFSSILWEILWENHQIWNIEHYRSKIISGYKNVFWIFCSLTRKTQLVETQLNTWHFTLRQLGRRYW